MSSFHVPLVFLKLFWAIYISFMLSSTTFRERNFLKNETELLSYSHGASCSGSGYIPSVQVLLFCGDTWANMGTKSNLLKPTQRSVQANFSPTWQVKLAHSEFCAVIVGLLLGRASSLKISFSITIYTAIYSIDIP